MKNKPRTVLGPIRYSRTIAERVMDKSKDLIIAEEQSGCALSQEKKMLEELLSKPKPVWDFLGEDELKETYAYAEDYRQFLSLKTEREVIEEIQRAASLAGFVNIAPSSSSMFGKEPRGFYQAQKGRSVALAVLGSRSLVNGCKIIVSHVDSPRLDLKPHPLMESVGMAMFRTHYYGGIKKYQWVTIPLAIHGVVFTIHGGRIDICVGEKPDDPVFTIADILPHLAKDQREKKIGEGVTGENLKIIIGSRPVENEDVGDRIKLWVLKYLKGYYGLSEEDFVSADLEIVPAGPARNVGFDESMIGGYGQDDRACVYASLRAILGLDAEKIQRPVIAFFLDKEEIGSEGNTSAQSYFIEQFIENLLKHRLARDCNAAEILARSEAISADVTAAVDPDWESAHDMQNAALLGYGVGFHKYGGSGGKYSASEASAEYVAKIRQIFKNADVIWQATAFGKVDHGGGGTVAMYFARRGMDIIDVGPPIVSMHSPFELVSKADIYMTYKAYKAFLEAE